MAQADLVRLAARFLQSGITCQKVTCSLQAEQTLPIEQQSKPADAAGEQWFAAMTLIVRASSMLKDAS